MVLRSGVRNLGNKKCCCCKLIKLLREFGYDSSTYDGRSNKCVRCKTRLSNEYATNRCKVDLGFRLILNVRKRTSAFFNKHKAVKDVTTMTELGVTLETFYRWFQYQADLEGLDLGSSNVHNDHVIPLDMLDPVNSALDKKFCYNAVNMRPLSSIENQRKSNKLVPEAIIQQANRANDFVLQLEDDE